MSFAADMLAKAQLAYQNALAAPLDAQINNRRVRQHDLDQLRSQVEYWQEQVRLEDAKATGLTRVGPIRFPL